MNLLVQNTFPCCVPVMNLYKYFKKQKKQTKVTSAKFLRFSSPKPANSVAMEERMRVGLTRLSFASFLRTPLAFIVCVKALLILEWLIGSFRKVVFSLEDVKKYLIIIIIIIIMILSEL